MRTYCTLFDRSYLPKGLCLYESLKRHSSEDFTLHVLALDNETAWLLTELALPHVEILPSAVFEKALDLEAIKASRTWQEWCWGCASSLMIYLMQWVGDVTYVDSDVYFFSDPKVIFDEMGNRSIGITPHRLIPSKKHLEVNGLFNVGIVAARRTRVGEECIGYWSMQCRKRCSATVGCGDQQYLDEWPVKYGSDVCVIENIGVNAGPWSLANWQVTEGPKLDGVQLVAYHAHEYQHQQRLTNYELRPADIECIYQPYIEAHWRADMKIVRAIEQRMNRHHQAAMQAERA